MSDSEDYSDNDAEEAEEVCPPPRAFKINNSITDLAMHPKVNLLATADMNGYIHVMKYESGEKSIEKSKFRVSKKTCRCVQFSTDGEDIITLSKLGSMKVTDTESTKVRILNKGAHNAPPFVLKPISKNIIVSGDDDGTMRLWDLRRGNDPIMDEDRCTDYISDIAVDNHARNIFVASGEGTMTTYNIKRKKFIVQSENIETDMTSAAVAKSFTKVLVGTAEGQILFYNWDEFAAPSDRFPVHESPLECITPISENIVCTGSGDGKIRAVHLLPNRFIGVVGEHKNMSIDKVECSWDKQFIASSSHGTVVKFWSVGHLCNQHFDGKDKMKRYLKNTNLKETGVGEDKKDFMNDIETELTAPVVETSSDEDDEDINNEENDL